MTRPTDDVHSAIRDAVRPTWPEIVRSKRAVLAMLADREPRGIRDLQSCLLAAEGAPPHVDRKARVVLSGRDHVSDTEPILHHYRLVYAATEAIVDLVAQGLVVPVAEAPTHETSDSIVRDLAIGYEHSGGRSAVRPDAPLPTMAAAYRVAPHLAWDDVRWFADPDVFVSDLEGLGLDQRTRRCIREALAAYRAGLHMSAANMLGAASEGAWYAAGERLRHLEPSLATALDNENTTKVRRGVANLLGNVSSQRSTVNALVAQAELLSELRNYGIHPRGKDTTHLEHYFVETAAAMLLMQAYNYFVRLGEAVDARIAH